MLWCTRRNVYNAPDQAPKDFGPNTILDLENLDCPHRVAVCANPDLASTIVVLTRQAAPLDREIGRANR